MCNRAINNEEPVAWVFPPKQKAKSADIENAKIKCRLLAILPLVIAAQPRFAIYEKIVYVKRLLINAKKPKKYNVPKKEISKLIDVWIGSELNKVRKSHFDPKNIDRVDICKGCSFKDTYEWLQIK